jgi:NAD(P)H-hydrate epimerase
MLAGLLAQNYSPLDTAILGVFLHGLSGDVAIHEKGMNSLIATDIVEFLPQAFLRAGYK